MAQPCIRSEDKTPTFTFSPLQFVTDKPGKYAIILLNGPLNIGFAQFSRIWNNASFRSVADGGTNGLKERYFTNGVQSQILPPDLISGDMDSAKPEYLDYFARLGTQVVHTPDQNQTDFTKNLHLVKEHLRSKLAAEIAAERKTDGEKQEESVLTYSIIALNAHGGRFDHEFANLNTLFLSEADDDLYLNRASGDGTRTESESQERIPVRFRVTLFSGDTFSCLLRGGRYHLRRSQLEADWCALVPLSCDRAIVTTKGLVWNVTSQPFAFGDLVSTSNAYEQSADEVFVDTDAPLIYSGAVKPAE